MRHSVSWEEAARRPAVSRRSSTPPSARDDPARYAVGTARVFFVFFGCKIDAKRGLKAGICRTRVAGQPQEGSGPTARAF